MQINGKGQRYIGLWVKKEVAESFLKTFTDEIKWLVDHIKPEKSNSSADSQKTKPKIEVCNWLDPMSWLMLVSSPSLVLDEPFLFQ